VQATNSDMRKHPRFNLKQPLLVVDDLSGENMGTLVNISQEGMMVFGNKTVVSDGVYHVSMPLKSEAGDDIVLSLGIECLWSNADDNDGKNWSGFKIIDISSEQQASLNQMIEQLSSNN